MQKYKNDSGGNIPDVEFYFLKHGSQKQARLRMIRSTVFEAFPDAQERIYYGTPTVELGGEIVLQYAAYKKHISLLIGSGFSALLKEKYPQYNYTDYTVLFLDDEPFPEEFIKEVIGMLDKVKRVIKPCR